MKLNWKYYTGALGALVLLAGCGGINSTGGVSPASFFLPGILMMPAPVPPALDRVPPALPPDSTAPSRNI